MDEALVPPVPPKHQWLPLACPNCSRSAYLVDVAAAAMAKSLQTDMLQRTDEKALEPHYGMSLQCPYCGDPLAIPRIYPVVGGGWHIEFRWVGVLAETK